MAMMNAKVGAPVHAEGLKTRRRPFSKGFLRVGSSCERLAVRNQSDASDPIRGLQEWADDACHVEDFKGARKNGEGFGVF
jgi:hypothetical protein